MRDSLSPPSSDSPVSKAMEWWNKQSLAQKQVIFANSRCADVWTFEQFRRSIKEITHYWITNVGF